MIPATMQHDDNSPRTTAAIFDELVYQLSSASSFTIDENTGHIHITHKYYDIAEIVLYRINIWNPSTRPVLQKELEQLKRSDPRLFDRVVTDTIQALMEGINERYYHVSGVAYKISWRFDP